MKIISVAQFKEADKYTIEHEPISSINLMERAARRCSEWILEHFNLKNNFVIFCGPANNGGDGLVISRLLANAGKVVTVYTLNINGKFTEEFLINKQRLINECKVIPIEISENDFTIQTIPSDALIIDAIFGNGLSRPVNGWLKELFSNINNLPNCKVAIDLPSGLSGDDIEFALTNPNGIIKCNYTLTFQTYKLSLLLTEGIVYAGEVVVLDINLSEDYFLKVETKFFAINKLAVQSLLKERLLYGHKGSFGHALLLCGSAGYSGAAALSAKAALSSGCGLTTVLTHPDCLNTINYLVPEAITRLYINNNNEINLTIPQKCTAIGIGCGLSVDNCSLQLLKQLINQYTGPLVIDADALNLLAQNKTMIPYLPLGTILTPHPGEFDRLFNLKNPSSYHRLSIQQEISVKYGIYIVLKNYRTSISTPKGRVFFNTTGNNGMATAGSGDVLTGIITGLLAQGYAPLESCIIGVYLHGLAGDLAKEHYTEYALLARHIIDYMGKAFGLMKNL